MPRNSLRGGTVGAYLNKSSNVSVAVFKESLRLLRDETTDFAPNIIFFLSPSVFGHGTIISSLNIVSLTSGWDAVIAK